jgi:uncharacterized membrane protein YhhN
MILVRDAKWKRRFPALLIIPVALGILALATHRLWFKLGEPASCGLLLILFGSLFGLRHAGFIVAAFLWSMVGDYFLSNRPGHEHYFVFGIGAFFVAHLGYLAFAIKNGRFSGMALFVLLAGYLPFFGFCLNPAIKDMTLRIAALLYLLVSCVSMAAAVGLRLPSPSKTFYMAGIGLVLFSDTLIAWSEFLHYRNWNWLILPTYYLAHIFVTLALISAPEHRETPGEAIQTTPPR